MSGRRRTFTGGLADPAFIHTSHGLRKLDELLHTALVPGVRNATLALGTGEATKAYRVRVGTSSVMKIQVGQHTRPILAARNQRWLCQTPLEYIAKRTDRLEVNDCICSPLANPVRPLSTYCRERDISYWLGFVLANRDFGKKSTYVEFDIKRRPELVQAITRFYEFARLHHWGVAGHNKGGGEPRVQLNASRCPLGTYLQQQGCGNIFCTGGHAVPKQAYSSVHAARNFLWGVLESYEVSIASPGKRNTAWYGVSSPRLDYLRDLYLLCKYAGIGAALRMTNVHCVQPYLSMHAYDVENLFYPKQMDSRRKVRISRVSLAPVSACDEFLATVPLSSYKKFSSQAVAYSRIRRKKMVPPWFLREMYLSADAAPPPIYEPVKVTAIDHTDLQQTTYTFIMLHSARQFVANGAITKT